MRPDAASAAAADAFRSASGRYRMENLFRLLVAAA
jgi:hypothetical protein